MQRRRRILKTVLDSEPQKSVLTPDGVWNLGLTEALAVVQSGWRSDPDYITYIAAQKYVFDIGENFKQRSVVEQSNVCQSCHRKFDQ